MPIYEYKCEKAGCEAKEKVKENLQKSFSSPPPECEVCGSEMTKCISAAGFQLKGTGWYQTDFKHK